LREGDELHVARGNPVTSSIHGLCF
jgi:hypothetical protein